MTQITLWEVIKKFCALNSRPKKYFKCFEVGHQNFVHSHLITKLHSSILVFCFFWNIFYHLSRLMCNLSLTCLLCSLWSWGSIWTACFWTCATILRWVEFHCARCWTSAANTLGTPLATPPSPTSENWSDWYWEAYPRYVPHFFDVEQLEHSEIFSLFLPHRFIPGNEGWNNSYVISFFFFFPAVCILSCFSTPVLCFILFFLLPISFFSSAGRPADGQGVSSRAQ